MMWSLITRSALKLGRWDSYHYYFRYQTWKTDQNCRLLILCMFLIYTWGILPTMVWYFEYDSTSFTRLFLGKFNQQNNREEQPNSAMSRSYLTPRSQVQTTWWMAIGGTQNMPGSGPIFCFFLEVSPGFARPMIGQVTSGVNTVYWPGRILMTAYRRIDLTVTSTISVSWCMWFAQHIYLKKCITQNWYQYSSARDTNFEFETFKITNWYHGIYHILLHWFSCVDRILLTDKVYQLRDCRLE